MCQDRAGQPFPRPNRGITDINQSSLGGVKMKTCTKCGEAKPTTEFYKHARCRDGVRPDCKACCNAESAKRYADNPGKGKAKAAKWRAENPDKVLANNDQWAADNPEKIRASKAKWKAANPEACRIHDQNRRAREIEAGGKLSKGLAARLFKLQRGKCACGCKQPLGNDYHLDHRMPLALGGTNTDDNMQLLRQRCNLSKGAKHPVEFMQSRGLLL